MITIIGSKDLFADGTGPFDSLADLAAKSNTPSEWKQGNIEFYLEPQNLGDQNGDWIIDCPTVVAFVGLGGIVTGFPCFIKMTLAQYALEVPAGIRGREYIDENEVTIVRTWSEWKDATHNHSDAADGLHKLVPGNSWGVELDGDEMAILAAAGYTLLTPPQYLAELPSETP